jgi:hypothetical protein
MPESALTIGQLVRSNVFELAFPCGLAGGFGAVVANLTLPLLSVRKEVIQPQVLLQLPCYDFTPIMNHTVGACLPCGLARRLLVQPTFVM